MPEINLLPMGDEINQICSALAGFAKAVIEFIDVLLAFLVKQNVISRRVVHLAYHAKKARIRKKNKNRIVREFERYMKAR